MIERKCLNCGTWNKAEKFCVNCQNAIDPAEILKIEDERKRIEEANKPKDQFDILMERMREHRYFLVRIIYKTIYSVGLVFAAIGAFLAWIVALSNG